MDGVVGVKNSSFFETWKKVLLSPSEFFSSMPISGGYLEPYKFAVICGIPLMALSILGSLFSGDILDLVITPIGYFIGLAFGLLFATAMIFVASIIFARNENKGFESIFRIVSYSNVLYSIPLIGGLYGWILTVIGLREVFKVSTLRAIVLTVVFVVALVGGITVAAVIIFAIYSRMMRGA